MIKLFEGDEEPEGKAKDRGIASLNITPDPGPEPVNSIPEQPSVYDAFSEPAPAAATPEPDQPVEKVREEPIELRREEFPDAGNQPLDPPVRTYPKEKPPSSEADAAAAYTETDQPEAEVFVKAPYTPPTSAETVRSTGLAFNAGIIFFGSIVFMLILGWGADLLLGSAPWGIVGGIILGSVIGFIQFFRISSQIFRK